MAAPDSRRRLAARVLPVQGILLIAAVILAIVGLWMVVPLAFIRLPEPPANVRH